MLKQVVKRLFSSIFGASKVDPSHDYSYGDGDGSSGATNHTNGSRKRDPSFTQRQHVKLDDSAIDEDIRADIYLYGRRTGSQRGWASNEMYPMASFAYQGTSDDGRKSDEKPIMSEKDEEQNRNLSIVENVGIPSNWPLAQGPSTTKKVEV